MLPHQLDSGFAQFSERAVGGVRCYSSGQVDQHPGAKPFRQGVARGESHAVVSGNSDDVHVDDAPLVQPFGQRCAVLVDALETTECGAVSAFFEHGLNGAGVEIGMELRAPGGRSAVWRPGVSVIGMVGKVCARIDVPILGGHHMPVGGLTAQVVGDGVGHGGPAGYRNGAAFTEIVLHVDNDQRPHSATLRVRRFSGLVSIPSGNKEDMLIRRIARPMLSAVFIGQGIESLLNPKPAAQAAGPAAVGLSVLPEPIGSSAVSDPQTFAQINAAVQIGGGLLLATGRMPRVASAALALTVVPANLGAHLFWQEPDPQRRAEKRRALLADVSLVGGLIIAAADTEGKPSLGWRGRRAAKRLSEKVSAVLPEAGDAVSDSELAEKVAHVIDLGAERSRELATAAVEKGAPLARRARRRSEKLAEVARERGAELATAAAVHSSHLAEIARERGTEFAEVARERGAELAEATAARSNHFAELAAARGSHLAEVGRERIHEAGAGTRRRCHRSRRG